MKKQGSRMREPLVPSSTECAKMRAAIYCRKSNESIYKAVSKRGNSVEEQLEWCLRDCEYYGFGQVTQFAEWLCVGLNRTVRTKQLCNLC